MLKKFGKLTFQADKLDRQICSLGISSRGLTNYYIYTFSTIQYEHLNFKKVWIVFL